MKKTYEEGYVAGFSHNTEVIVNLEIELDNANSKVSKLSNRILKAIEYLEKNALAPIFLDCKMYETSAYNDLLEILKGSDK